MSLAIPMPNPFPQELVDKIIDDITGTGTHQTLEACSMVCRAWRPRATYRLFRRDFTLSLRRSHTNDRIRASPIYITFSNPPSRRATFITAITLSGISRIRMLQSVLGCLHLYPNLRALTFKDIDFFKFNLTQVKALSRDFHPTSLHHLKLEAISFSEFAQFIAFIYHFPNLSVLVLQCIKYGHQRGKARWSWSSLAARIVAKRDPTSDSPSFSESLRGISEDFQSTRTDPYVDVLKVLGSSITHLFLRGTVVSYFMPDLFPSLTHLSMEVDFQLQRSEQLEAFASTASPISVVYLHMLGGYFDEVRILEELSSTPDRKRTVMTAIDRLIAPVSRTPSLEKLMLDYFIFKDFELPQTNKKGCVHIVPEYESGAEREVFEVEHQDV
ncbi:hypothetical protein VKT23_009354 [Stygiomarasmius scandens]|uniref:F-box domain-containing protein n=1 Tax=Marasmiellus scandens TaxID=2682957 RepID=A0ABR1JIJ6_9AGAR